MGYWNLSAYNHGAMGYRTPNIDRLAKEGALFTDYYGQQSCTAGRAAFITGQSPIRTGLTKVGLPGSPLGLQKDDPTIADLLKPLGYMTFQNGKNHLGDRNEFLPTVHGFDEFFGNLYHLNAEQEPENVDYPKNPAFAAKFGPRGVLKCKATTTDNPAPADPRFGAWGKQTCEDTGPLTIERMKTADEEFLKATLDDMDLATKAGKPFFIWHNTTRMHIWTHLQPKYEAMVAKYGLYGAGMQELDDNVGVLLKKLDDLGIANNTIVIFSSDNGAEVMSWPDGGATPFRGEKNTNWEGGYRVPFVIRWPGVVKPGTEVNEIAAHEDWMPTLLAAAGVPDVKEKLLTGYQAGELNLQGPSGRLQPDAISERRYRQVSSQGVPLLDRRRRPCRTSLRQMEGQFHGPACSRLRRLGGALCDLTCPIAASICIPILLSADPRRGSTTATGESTASSCLFPRRPTSANGYRPSSNFRHGRNRPASTSATRFRS